MAASRFVLLPSLTALALALSACSALLPTALWKPPAPVSPAAKATPKPALTLAGRVAVDPTLLIAEKLAVPSARGVLILGNNGGNLTSKTKLGRSLLAVEGMRVVAYSQIDGEMVAGPVMTDADGRYALAFEKKPKGNVLVVAAVESRASDERFTYPTLLPATDGEARIDTSDVTRAVTHGILKVLPGRLQPIIDARAKGESATVYLGLLPHPKIREALTIVDRALAPLPAERVKALSEAGLADAIARRMTAVIDLADPTLQAYYDTMGEVRAFEETLPDYLDLCAKTSVLAFAFTGPAPIAQALEGYGMAAERAEPVADRLAEQAIALGVVLSEAGIAHQDEVLTVLDQ